MVDQALDSVASTRIKDIHEWGQFHNSRLVLHVLAHLAYPADPGLLLDLRGREPRLGKAALNLEALCALAASIGLKARTPEEREKALALYDLAYRRLGGRLPGEHQELHVTTAHLHGRTRQVKRLIKAYDSLPDLLLRSLRCQEAHPNHGGSPAAYMRRFRQFTEWPELVGPEPGAALHFDGLRTGPLEPVDRGPMISVVMTCFKPGGALLTAVRSIVAQTWQNWELLLVDDASGPEYESVLLEAASLDPRVKLLIQPENAGTYQARNRAMAVAAGKFITGLDSDDWAHPRRLELQVRPMVVNPDLVMVESRCVAVAEDLSLMIDPQIAIIAARSTPIMIRSEAVLKKVGFYDEVRKTADSEYRFRIQNAFGKGSFLRMGNGPLTAVRYNGNTLSAGEVSRHWMSASRFGYYSGFARWHRAIGRDQASPFMASLARPRPFPITRCITRSNADNQAIEYGRVYAADWSALDATRCAMLAEAGDTARGGVAVALLHCPDLKGIKGDQALVDRAVLTAASEDGLDFVEPEGGHTAPVITPSAAYAELLRFEHPGIDAARIRVHCSDRVAGAPHANVSVGAGAEAAAGAAGVAGVVSADSERQSGAAGAASSPGCRESAAVAAPAAQSDAAGALDAVGDVPAREAAGLAVPAARAAETGTAASASATDAASSEASDRRPEAASVAMASVTQRDAAGQADVASAPETVGDASAREPAVPAARVAEADAAGSVRVAGPVGSADGSPSSPAEAVSLTGVAHSDSQSESRGLRGMFGRADVLLAACGLGSVAASVAVAAAVEPASLPWVAGASAVVWTGSVLALAAWRAFDRQVPARLPSAQPENAPAVRPVLPAKDPGRLPTPIVHLVRAAGRRPVWSAAGAAPLVPALAVFAPEPWFAAGIALTVLCLLAAVTQLRLLRALDRARVSATEECRAAASGGITEKKRRMIERWELRLNHGWSATATTALAGIAADSGKGPRETQVHALGVLCARRAALDPRPGRTHTVDIAIVSTFNLRGGTTSANQAEILAYVSAGLRVALVNHPVKERAMGRPIDPKITALVDGEQVVLVDPRDTVHCDLTIVRFPVALAEMMEDRPQIVAGRTVLLVNQAPFEEYGPTGGYGTAWSIPDVHRNVTEWLGEHTWYAIGPAIRDVLHAHHAEEMAGIALAEDFWYETIDIAEWTPQERRVRAEGEPIRLGRHSRDHVTKFPNMAKQLLAAYPDTDGIEVHMLGGHDALQRILGTIPRRWVSHPFGTMSAVDFLGQVDVYAYFVDENLVEAFGRAPMEAMAAGVPTILSPDFEELFGDGAVYREPEDVEAEVRRLAADAAYRTERAEAGLRTVRERFSPEALLRRVNGLGVTVPSRSDAPATREDAR
ncbi:glycosyltransferase [Glycomyces sp. NPDC048151]|uniref:glycosyltransferase n=1 Tax=Glycomyces sp. NPDC048151 TaxID=3364002 RepID=UPI003716AD7D